MNDVSVSLAGWAEYILGDLEEQVAAYKAFFGLGLLLRYHSKLCQEVC